MKKIHLVIFIALSGLTITMPVKAADFNYFYGQLTYDDVDVDLGQNSRDENGISITGSFEINPDMFISASYGNWDDVSGYELGVGYHMPINQKTDMVLGVSFGNIEVDYRGGSADSDVLEISAGVRHQLDSKIELDAEVAYVDYDEGDSDFGFEFAGLYAFTNNLSGIASLSFGDDVDVLSLGVRMYF